MDVNVNTVSLCLKKFKEGGVAAHTVSRDKKSGMQAIAMAGNDLLSTYTCILKKKQQRRLRRKDVPTVG